MSNFRVIHSPKSAGERGRLNSPKKLDKIGVLGCFCDPNIWGYCQQKTTRFSTDYCYFNYIYKHTN